MCNGVGGSCRRGARRHLERSGVHADQLPEVRCRGSYPHGLALGWRFQYGSTQGNVRIALVLIARLVPPPDHTGHDGDDEDDGHWDEAFHALIVGSSAE